MGNRYWQSVTIADNHTKQSPIITAASETADKDWQSDAFPMSGSLFLSSFVYLIKYKLRQGRMLYVIRYSTTMSCYNKRKFTTEFSLFQTNHCFEMQQGFGIQLHLIFYFVLTLIYFSIANNFLMRSFYTSNKTTVSSKTTTRMWNID